MAKITDDEYAFGWLVLGVGLSRREAQNWIMNANIHLRQAWAEQQRKACRGFWVLIRRTLAEKPRLPIVWKPNQ